MGYRQLRFSLAHRLAAHTSRKLNFPYTVRHGLIAGMRRQGGLGFMPWGPPETEEMTFLRRLDLTGQVVYDIGAFEGVMTLFFSTRAHRVIAYEPNPVSRRRLMKNLELNRTSNVRLRDVALAEMRAELALVYDPLMPGAASGAAATIREIRDGAPTTESWNVTAVRLDDDIAEQNLPPPDFIKIDVERMELPVLKGAAETLGRSRPALYIELHGAEEADKLQNAADVVGFLWSIGYQDIRDVERGTMVTPANVVRPSHIYCRCRSHVGIG